MPLLKKKYDDNDGTSRSRKRTTGAARRLLEVLLLDIGILFLALFLKKGEAKTTTTITKTKLTDTSGALSSINRIYNVRRIEEQEKQEKQEQCDPCSGDASRISISRISKAGVCQSLCVSPKKKLKYFISEKGYTCGTCPVVVVVEEENESAVEGGGGAEVVVEEEQDTPVSSSSRTKSNTNKINGGGGGGLSHFFKSVIPVAAEEDESSQEIDTGGGEGEGEGDSVLDDDPSEEILAPQKTMEPTWQPTPNPITTRQPTSSPVGTPTSSPTMFPTQMPTMPPTLFPTTQTPTLLPTTTPTTLTPSMAPTTLDPTSNPTIAPTSSQPTPSPSMVPTTSFPTSIPTRGQSLTLQPSSEPSTRQITTLGPTANPTSSAGRVLCAERDIGIADPDSYSLCLDLAVDVRDEDLFIRAADEWSTKIVGDLPDVYIPMPWTPCGTSYPTIVDDLYLCGVYRHIDGEGGVLGSAGPTYLRTGTKGLPAAGTMEFDTADVELMRAQGTLEGVILHEMGHILGIGTLWESFGIVKDSSFTCPYSGVHANREWQRISGCAGDSVPMELDGGSGTRCGHFDDGCLQDEIMTGFLGGREPIFSTITLGTIQDLGYPVQDYSESMDDFTRSHINPACTCRSTVASDGGSRRRLRGDNAALFDAGQYEERFGAFTNNGERVAWRTAHDGYDDDSSSSSYYKRSEGSRRQRQRRRLSDKGRAEAIKFGMSKLKKAKRAYAKDKVTTADVELFADRYINVMYIEDSQVYLVPVWPDTND